MSTETTIETYTPKPTTRNRNEIQEKYRWNVHDIFADWKEWKEAYSTLEKYIKQLTVFRGTLAQENGAKLMEFLKLSDEADVLSYRLWYFPMLQLDEDQRKNEIDAYKQQIQNLFAKFNTAISWYAPEVLEIGIETIREWMDKSEPLALYRFSLEELYRQQEHVLDEKGETLLSLSSRFGSSPGSIYSMITTADAKHPDVTLSDGQEVTVSPSTYSSMLHTLPKQEDRKTIFEAHYSNYADYANTYAAIYNGILQRGWFHAQARNYESVLEMKLFGNKVPTSVFETLINTAKEGTAPLQRYHELRKRALKIDEYHLYDGFAQLFKSEKKYGYDQVRELILDSVKVLGDEYVSKMREAFDNRWIDVYENEGKRSGAYSAGVYGVHPYMLLNYQDTLNDVFTLAHELGHTMHTILSDETQPFVYHSYTIFVAEVASTLNEALLLNTMLERSDDPLERAALLQQAIDSLAGTFYTQAMFANYEYSAHQLAEQGHPITADVLNELYFNLLKSYHGNAITLDSLYQHTWARIPHFYNSPFYVYQYATCYASSATLMKGIQNENAAARADAIERYTTLLKSGGNDHPMALLQRAGADLNDSNTVLSVVDQLNSLVTQLEQELNTMNML